MDLILFFVLSSVKTPILEQREESEIKLKGENEPEPDNVAAKINEIFESFAIDESELVKPVLRHSDELNYV